MGSDDASVADLLLSRPPGLSTARLLAVDGPAGSGKTTLASHVQRLLDSRGCSTALVSLDDLYEGWGGLDDNLEHRVLRQVLLPLAAGGQARWQAYDWQRSAFARWHSLPLPQVLVLEGCGAGARRYAPYTTLLVWVEASAPVRTERVVARDGPDVLEHWALWAAAEDRHFAANDTRSRADLRIRT